MTTVAVATRERHEAPVEQRFLLRGVDWITYQAISNTLNGRHVRLNRMGIYAALGIPEVWTFDGESLRVHQLNDDEQYGLVTRSRYFLNLPIDELVAFLGRRDDMDENSLVRSFRAWVQTRMKGGSGLL